MSRIGSNPVELGPLARLERPTAEEFAPYAAAAKPVVVGGGMSAWNALRAWTPAFIEAKTGDASVPVITLSADQPAGRFFYADGKVVERPVRECLPLLRGEAPRAYMAGVPIKRYLPALAEDIAVPDFLGRSRRATSALWISGKNSTGPLHYDLDDNVHALVGGLKRFVLFDYDQSPALYPNRAFSDFPHYSGVDPVNPDFQRHPRFREARGYEVVLTPGDMLYIPVGCWHQVTTLEPSIAVTFWLGKHFFQPASLRVLVPLLLRLPLVLTTALLAGRRRRRAAAAG